MHTDETRNIVMDYIIQILQPLYEDTICFKPEIQTVLINSNFRCGFDIDREILLSILEKKYNIRSIFDSCSYPGIKCKYYYNNKLGIQYGKQCIYNKSDDVTPVSFMIFRTGSVIIVGNCNIDMINDIYCFVKKILHDEYNKIRTNISNCNNSIKQPKILRKKILKIKVQI
jgi:hypothetical protein